MAGSPSQAMSQPSLMRSAGCIPLLVLSSHRSAGSFQWPHRRPIPTGREQRPQTSALRHDQDRSSTPQSPPDGWPAEGPQHDAGVVSVTRLPQHFTLVGAHGVSGQHHPRPSARSTSATARAFQHARAKVHSRTHITRGELTVIQVGRTGRGHTPLVAAWPGVAGTGTKPQPARRHGDFFQSVETMSTDN